MSTRLFATTAPRSTILIRLMVGIVFAAEGIQKFLFAPQLGVGRFARIGGAGAWSTDRALAPGGRPIRR